MASKAKKRNTPAEGRLGLIATAARSDHDCDHGHKARGGVCNVGIDAKYNGTRCHRFLIGRRQATLLRLCNEHARPIRRRSAFSKRLSARPVQIEQRRKATFILTRSTQVMASNVPC
jgi:hypothetical protein